MRSPYGLALFAVVLVAGAMLALQRHDAPPAAVALETVTEAWVHRDGIPAGPQPDVATDPFGNVYVAGYAQRASDSAYGLTLLKYAADGTLLW